MAIDSAYKKTKWHYYHHTDDLCNYIADQFPKSNEFRMTACGRYLHEVRKHTEFKDGVTCLKCLRRVNKLDNR